MISLLRRIIISVISEVEARDAALPFKKFKMFSMTLCFLLTICSCLSRWHHDVFTPVFCIWDFVPQKMVLQTLLMWSTKNHQLFVVLAINVKYQSCYREIWRTRRGQGLNVEGKWWKGCILKPELQIRHSFLLLLLFIGHSHLYWLQTGEIEKKGGERVQWGGGKSPI